MIFERQDEGFTLVEVIVVLAVLGLLLGTATPLAGAVVDAERRASVTEELRAIAVALEDYYEDQGSFPATLTDAGFYGVYLQSGINGSAVIDGWGSNLPYTFAQTANPDVARVHSVGEDATNSGFANEELRIEVAGAAPGMRRTRERMRVIVQAVGTFIEGGGTLSGTWATDRVNLGLGTDYDLDGFGTAFRLGTDYVLRSAGADRSFGTVDDLGT